MNCSERYNFANHRATFTRRVRGVKMEIKLLFAADSPPLSVIAAAKIGGVPLSVDPSLPSGSVPSFVFSNG